MKFDSQPILLELIKELREKKMTVGFAESCTGGLLSAWMASVAGVSDVYIGSVVSYSYEAKRDLLGVDWEQLNKEGAVSEVIALQMAHGLKARMTVDCVVSVTGIAGPSGGTTEKPVGTVCFAAVGPHFEVTEKMYFLGDRNVVQNQSADYALRILLNYLRALPKKIDKE
jgi:nicotinamide-nucleotide amidase